MSIKIPQNENYNDFMSWWTCVKENFTEMLDFDFSSQTGQKRSISKLLNRAKQSFLNKNNSGVIDLNDLFNLVQDLDFLKTNNYEFFNTYKSKLISGLSNNFFYLTGTWFEIRIARMLIETKFSFEQPDPPDFEIKINGNSLGIECYAPRARIGDDILKRISNSIKNKEREYKKHPWKSSHTILFIDGTWLKRAEGSFEINTSNLLTSQFREGLIQAINKNKCFEFVIVFFFGHDRTKNGGSRSYSCVYSPTTITNLELSQFKNTFLENYIEGDNQILLPDLPDD